MQGEERKSGSGAPHPAPSIFRSGLPSKVLYPILQMRCLCPEAWQRRVVEQDSGAWPGGEQ